MPNHAATVVWGLMTLGLTLFILVSGGYQEVPWDVPFWACVLTAVNAGIPKPGNGETWKQALSREAQYTVYSCVIYWSAWLVINADEKAVFSGYLGLIYVIVIAYLFSLRRSTSPS